MKARMYNFSTWVEGVEPVGINDLLKKAGFGIESTVEKRFDPIGYTVIFLLSESHLAIHTFPEENVYYLELSSCVKKPFNKFIKLLLK